MWKTSQRTLALSAVIALVVAYASLLLYLYLANRDRAFAGIEAGVPQKLRSGSPKDRTLIVSEVTAGGPADVAGIRPHDVIRAIDGITIGETKRLTEFASKKRPGDRVLYTIERRKKTIVIPVVVESMMPIGRVLRTGLPTSLLIGAFVIIGLIVFWKKPGERQAVVFFAMTLIAALQFAIADFSEILGRLGDQGLREPGQSIYLHAGERSVVLSSWLEGKHFLFVVASLLLFVLLLTMLLHLALIFPRPRPIVLQQPKIVPFLYIFPAFLLIAVFCTTLPPLIREAGLDQARWLPGIPIVLFGLATFAFRRKRHAGNWKENVVDHPIPFFLSLLMLQLTSQTAIGVKLQPKWLAGIAVIGGAIVVIAAAASALALPPIYAFATVRALHRNYRDSGVDEKRQVKWPLWGTSVAVGGISLLIFIALMFGFLAAVTERVLMPNAVETIIEDILMPALWLLIPISFAIGILRYRLLDIDVIIRKTVVYSIVTVVVAFLYLLLVGGFGTMLVHTAGIESQAVTVISTLVLAAVLIPLRNRVQAAVDRRFFRKKLDYPDSLRKLNHEIATAGDLEEAMKRAADRIQMTLQSRSVAIFTAPPQERSLTPAATVGLTDSIAGRLRIDRATDWLQISDTVSRAADDESLRKVGAETIARIRSHGRLTGLVAVGRSLSEAEYDMDDIGFLGAAAETIAVGIESLRMRDEEKEFATARSIQLGLLPKAMPKVEGFDIAGVWNPARVVGGDYYDVFVVAPDRVVLCIGDVAGKGIPAALLMSSLQASVRAIAPIGLSPSETVFRIKQLVAGNMTAGKFITFFFGVVDAGRRTLTYVNAGHNAPILIGRERVERLERGGSALARLFVSAPYEEETVSLQSGDVLLLFTDGVTEARDPETLDDFGDDRIIELLRDTKDESAEAIEQRVVETIERHTRGEVQDDVTMIAVRVM